MAGASSSDKDEAADEEADNNDDGLSGVLRDDYYKNWVKGAEALALLQNGLASFVDREIYNKHALFLNKLPSYNQGTSGCNCTFENILPDHAITSCKFPNCFCKAKGRKRRKCPNKGYCSTFCNLILTEHRRGDPLWKNSDIKVWPTDHWSIAKCYMTTQTPSNSAKTTDALALLSVIINGKFFANKVASPLGQRGDVFQKAKELRNDILHRAKLELTDAELQDTIDTCIAVLKDPTTLLHDQDAVLAVKHLESLRKDELKVTTEEETRLLHERKEALRQMLQEEASKGIQKLKEEEAESKEALRQMIDEETVKSTQKVEEARSEAVKSVDQKINQVLDDLKRLNEETVQKVQKTGSGTLDSIDERKNEVLHDLTTFKEEMVQRIKEVESGAVESVDEKLNKIVDELCKFREETIKTIQRIGSPETQQETFNQELPDIRLQLANHLWKHYTTTSLSPLKTRENDIHIDEVYTEPNMEIEEKTTEQDKDQRSSRIRLTQYRDIFETKGKRLTRIYVLGEVGTGKTAFCQMLIHKWCKFIFGDSQDDSELMKMMQQFDFVFYLPLRGLQTGGNLKDMIKWYYKHEVSKEMVDYILSELSDKTLILADGLDEWKSSSSVQRPVHVTDGIPDAEDMKAVTLITTSRPSAQGVLNMKSTEYDRKIILSGIKTKALDTMAERYCAKLDKENKQDVLKRLKHLEIKDLENMPLILKQIVWMLGKGFQITCISGLYSDIVKIAVKWAYDKYKQEMSHFEPNTAFSNLRLPEQLRRASFIEECENLVLSLSEIAFEMLTSETDQTFERCKLRKYGIGDGQLKALISVGLLSEDNIENPMDGDTQFYFPHTSFVEYFAAVFIASHLQTCPDSASEVENYPDSTNFLSKLFKKYHSIEDVLNMNIVLKFVCGFAPNLTQCVCQNIYSIAGSCKELSMERKGMYRGNYFFPFKIPDVQRLIADFVTECKKSSSSATLQIPIFDLIVTDESYSTIRSHIEGHTVQHLVASQYMTIYSAFSVDCSKFTQLKCVQFNNLSETKELHTLHNLHMTKMEKVVLIGQLIPELLKTETYTNLQEMIVYITAPHPHSHSEVTGFLNLISHTKTLRVIEITELTCSECKEHNRHVMDLSQHDKLQTLEVTYSAVIHVQATNNSNLERVTFDTYCSGCFRAIRNSPKLMDLRVWVECAPAFISFTKEMNMDICSCTQLQYLTLFCAVIFDYAPLQLHNGMERLSSIGLYDVSMSESTFIKFVESLLTLRKSVEVSVGESQCGPQRRICGMERFESYIKNSPEKFEFLRHSTMSCGTKILHRHHYRTFTFATLGNILEFNKPKTECHYL